jgi:peptidoglycan/xylan/chitin deacetylase (PgdA/CDA1 family)
MFNPIARERFAAANNWRYSRGFTIDACINGKYSGGMNDRDAGYEIGLTTFDHPEYYRWPKAFGGRPAAIMGHNYHDGDLRKLIDKLAGALVLHVPPAGKAASWYYPGGTLPMCATQPGVRVVWPTESEMADMAAAHAEEQEQRDRAFSFRERMAHR